MESKTTTGRDLARNGFIYSDGKCWSLESREDGQVECKGTKQGEGVGEGVNRRGQDSWQSDFGGSAATGIRNCNQGHQISVKEGTEGQAKERGQESGRQGREALGQSFEVLVGRILMNLRRYARRHNHTDLIRHARRVARFGGRENVGARIKNAILNSNLGGSHVFDTTAANPSTVPVMLCEMSLPKAIPVDLVFSMPNRRIDPNGGAKLADDPATDVFQPLDVGSGFVRIRWGTNGGQVQSVDVDAGVGWRYPFIASFVSMEYHPQDNTQWVGTPAGTNSPVIGGQPRDLLVSASIVPGSTTAPVFPLTKTMYYPDLDSLGFEEMPIPDRARTVTVQFRVGSSLNSVLYEFRPGDGGNSVGGLRTNNSANQWPTYLVYKKLEMIPQKAGLLRIVSAAVATIPQNVSAIYELSI